MAHPLVEAAFRARLTAGFIACPVLDEGVMDPPAGLNPFVVLQFPFNRSNQATAGDPGNNVYREEGGARIVMHVRRTAAAIASGKAWCAEIATLFRGREFDGVRTYAPGSPVTDDRSDAAGYIRLSFAVPYDFDLSG